jgi:hypothetical protein
MAVALALLNCGPIAPSLLGLGYYGDTLQITPSMDD